MTERLLQWAIAELEASDVKAIVDGWSPKGRISEFADDEDESYPSQPGVYLSASNPRRVHEFADECELDVYILAKGKRSDVDAFVTSVSRVLSREPGRPRDYVVDPADKFLRLSRIVRTGGVPTGRTGRGLRGYHAAALSFGVAGSEIA